MKIILQSVVRALCAIAVGALLIEYRQDMVLWMTIIIGVLFFLSGVIATTMAYVNRKMQARLYAEAQGCGDENVLRPSRGWRWGMAAGTGSMLLGAVLALMPGTFVSFLIYVLSALLIIGAIQQYVTLFMSSRLGRVGIVYWVMPTLLLLAGLTAVAYPSAIASSPLFFIGWCMIIYGVVECINGIKAYLCNKSAATMLKNNNMSDGKPNFEDAETVEYEEVKE